MLINYDLLKLEYVGKRHFFVALLLAVVVHLMAGFSINLIPVQRVMDIPVRALNVRLGGDEFEVAKPDVAPPPPNTAVAQAVAAVSRVEQEKVEKEVKKTPPPEKPKPQTPERSLPQAKQFVRPPTHKAEIKPAVKQKGVSLGNSIADDAEVKALYEQTISLWIQKFRLYPEEARANGEQGRSVVRVRIDRRGNIRYSAIESSAGSELLDIATLDMVRRANPVPAVPDDYPDGEVFEFLIPVTYKLRK